MNASNAKLQLNGQIFYDTSNVSFSLQQFFHFAKFALKNSKKTPVLDCQWLKMLVSFVKQNLKPKALFDCSQSFCNFAPLCFEQSKQLGNAKKL